MVRYRSHLAHPPHKSWNLAHTQTGNKANISTIISVCVVGVGISRCNAVMALTLVDCHFHHYFPFFPIFHFIFSITSFSERRSAQIKNIFRESCAECPITKGLIPFHTLLAIFGPFMVIYKYKDGAALQVVNKPSLAPIDWYSFFHFFLRPNLFSHKKPAQLPRGTTHSRPCRPIS